MCRLQLLLALASAVILRSESYGTHNHILLSQILDSPNLEGQGCLPRICCPSNDVVTLFCLRGNVFTEPLPSSGRPLWLHDFGLQASCHSVLSI
jgi:hypothetical protein